MCKRSINLFIYGFYFANYMLVYLAFSQMSQALPFLFVGSGIILFGFFLNRLIHQVLS